MSFHYGFVSSYCPVPGVGLGLYRLSELEAACVYLQVHCYCDCMQGHTGSDFYSGYVRFLRVVSLSQLCRAFPGCVWFPIEIRAGSGTDAEHVDRLLPTSNGLRPFRLF